MSISGALLVLAAICIGWVVASAVLITIALDRRGAKTPFPFIGVFLFRNVHRYHEMTRGEVGKAGPLYYSFTIPATLALIFALAAVVARALGR
jgi:hypothetical protein